MLVCQRPQVRYYSGVLTIGEAHEVAACPESPRGALGLLHQPVYRLHQDVAVVIHHPSHHRLEALLERAGELPEGLQAAAPRPCALKH